MPRVQPVGVDTDRHADGIPGGYRASGPQPGGAERDDVPAARDRTVLHATHSAQARQLGRELDTRDRLEPLAVRFA